MELDIFFQPIESFTWENESIGSSVDCFIEGDFPDWKSKDVVIVGVQEDRNSCNNKGSEKGQDAIRKEFYQLYSLIDFQIADLGNVKKGQSVEDTYVAVSEVVKELILNGKFVIIIGGSQDLTYANYLGYEKMEQIINVVSIDNKIDVSNVAEENLNCSNYLNKIVLHKPNYLFNFSQIGHQGYLVKKSQLNLLEDLYFDAIRLGKVQEDIALCEPILRNADILSIDMKVMRNSEYASSQDLSPNGLFANEICQLMHFAGMSDKLSSVGIYEYIPELDKNGIGAKLIAQMIFFLVSGYYNRKGDYPMGLKSDNIKYVVHHDEIDHNLVFYKSPKSDRWWLEVPYPPRSDFKFERHHLVPCAYLDYESAMKENIPDIWWRTYRKLN